MGILLGIDVGETRTGVARSTGTLAEPLAVIWEKNPQLLAQKVAEFAQREEAEMVVIGLPEGKLENLAYEIGTWLQAKGIIVAYADETLTTQDAQWRAIEAGVNQKRRKEFEDAYAATLILQAYLDSQ